MTEQTPEPTIAGGEVTTVPELTEEQQLVEWTAGLASVDHQLGKERAQLDHVNENLRSWQEEQVRQSELVAHYERMRDDGRAKVQELLARVVVQSTQPEDQPDAPVVK